jgi:hypothetical protein
VGDVSVVVPYRYLDDERHALFEWAVTRWHRLLPDADINVAAGPAGPFNRAAAINAAVARARASTIVVADADVIVSRAGLAAALADPRWGFPFDVYYTMTEAWTAAALTADPGDELAALLTEPDPAHVVHRHPGAVAAPCESGCLIVARADLDRVGGFDESYVGWGYEDRAFVGTMRAHVAEPRRRRANALHLCHPVPAAHDPNTVEASANRRRYETTKRRGFPLERRP